MEEAFFIQQLHCNRAFSHDTENLSLSLPRHTFLQPSDFPNTAKARNHRNSGGVTATKTRKVNPERHWIILENLRVTLTWILWGKDLTEWKKKNQWKIWIPFSLISLKCELELNLGIFKVSVRSNREYKVPHSALWDTRELYCTARELCIE